MHKLYSGPRAERGIGKQTIDHERLIGSWNQGADNLVSILLFSGLE